MKKVYEFSIYKEYLMGALQEASKTSRGIRTQFSRAIGCQPSYLTRVLNESADLSLEQAELANVFFGHDSSEGDFFLLLVSHARSGTKALRERFEQQIKRAQRQYINLKQRFKIDNGFSERNEAIFYSSWHYGAILQATNLPALKTKEALRIYFKLSKKRISEVLERLVQMGLLVVEKGGYQPTNTWTNVTRESPSFSRNHTNWRLLAVQAVQEPAENDLHYTSVITLSEKDIFTVKSMLLESLEKVRSIIKDSKDEKICSFQMDFFEL